MAAPSVESGLNWHTSSNETTSLLLDQGIARYGSDVANEAGTPRNVQTNTRESPQSSEPHAFSRAARPPPPHRKSTSALNSFTRPPVDWTWSGLTGGWGDDVSLTLQNSGSVARDHLALERTFLAYTRTSLALASAGVALVQLFNTSNKAETEKIEKFARPLGASVIALGVLVLSMGLTRFFVVQNALVKGIFPVARFSATFLAVTLTALVTAVFSILVTGHLEF